MIIDKGKSTPAQPEKTAKGLPVPAWFIAFLAIATLAVVFGPTLIAGMGESAATSQTTPDASGTEIDTAIDSEENEDIEIETPKLINGVSIETQLRTHGGKEGMINDFFISNIKITDEKITFTVENKNEHYAQVLSTIILYCDFEEYKDSNGATHPLSQAFDVFYPNHHTRHTGKDKPIKNAEIILVKGYAIDLEAKASFQSFNYLEKISFRVTLDERIPMEMFEPQT